MNRILTLMLKCFGVLLCCTLLNGCTSLFFFPMQRHVMTPASLGYTYKDVYLRAADDTQLHAWLIEPKLPLRGTVYFLHGNAENISTHFRATVWLLESGYRVFALDYRGYGLSEGKPDVPEVFMDIEAGTIWLTQYLETADSSTSIATTQSPLFMLGQSLGASLAIKYAALDERFTDRFDGLITEAAFPRYSTIAKHVASRHWLTWSAQYPAKWLITHQYDPLDAIKTITDVPKLMIHSVDDEIIPYDFGQTLFQAAAEPKYWVNAKGPHIRAAADPAVRQAVFDFMQNPSDPGNLPESGQPPAHSFRR